MRSVFLAAAATAAILPAAVAAQQQEGAEATAGRPSASYAAHLAVWAEKCELAEAATLREELSGTVREGSETFEATFESYRTEVADAPCTEERRAQTEALVAEFKESGGSAP